LAQERADIDIAGGTLQERQERGKQCAAARAADGAGNGVAERTEVNVLHASSHGIAANRAGDELDDQIYQCP
jgi:hypothetical protein